MSSASANALVRERDAAEMLAVSVATLRKWRWSGAGPAYRKLGAAVRYDLTDLRSFIDAGRRRSTSDRGEVA